MSLPLAAIERLFSRMNATYGRDFMARYEGQDANAVKSSWAHELSGFANDLKSLAWALENLPERAPNVLEFRAICRRSPRDVSLALEDHRNDPVTDPKRIAEEILRLGALKARAVQPPSDMKDWARRIIARHDAGDPILPISLRFAREALDLSGTSQLPQE